MTKPDDPIGFIEKCSIVPKDMPKEWVEKVRELTVSANGLTKREYFAAMAMQGLMCDPEIRETNERIASFSVAMADALIVELSK